MLEVKLDVAALLDTARLLEAFASALQVTPACLACSLQRRCCSAGSGLCQALG